MPRHRLGQVPRLPQAFHLFVLLCKQSNCVSSLQMVTADIRDGYRGLANFVGSQLDSGLGVFKRFSQLNTLNLLYMQAELVVLEQELRVIAQIDDTCGDLNRYNFARSVRSMKGDPSSQQWSKVLECRRMLEKYSKLDSFEE